MITPKQAHYGINIGFHAWILFTFLTIFFFTFIARKEKESVTKELNSAIDDNIPVLFDNLDKVNKEVGITTNWNEINNQAIKIEQKYNGSDPAIDKHNKNLIKNAVIICSTLLLVLIGFIMYFIFYKKFNIHLTSILVENFFIALFVGAMELMFFLYVAIKYSPVTTADMVSNLIDRTEYRINEQFT